MISRMGNSQNRINYGYLNRTDSNRKLESNKVNLSNNEKTNSHQNAAKQVSFGGAGMPVVDGLIAFIEWMENGGKAVEFTVIDCMSMIMPRTFQAYNRNSKELGHPNYKAGTEEAIREFLTGPSMFLIPVMFMSTAQKLFGAATKIGFTNQDKFKETISDVAKDGFNKETKSNFYKKLLSEALGNGTQVQSEGTLETLAANVVEIESHNNSIAEKSKNPIKNVIVSIESNISKVVNFLEEKSPKFLKKPLTQIKDYINGAFKANLDIAKDLDTHKAKIKEFKKEISDKIISMNRGGDDDKIITKIANFINPDHVKLNKAKTVETFETSVGSLVDDMLTYAGDVINKGLKSKEEASKFIEKAANQRAGGRVLTIATAIASTAAFLYCIPMLYKRNKQYPGIDGLVKNSAAPQPQVKTPITQPVYVNNTVQQPTQDSNNPLLKAYQHGGIK